MLGNDPLTDTLMNFADVWRAVLIAAAYGLVLLAYLIDELGGITFRSERLERWYSRVTLYLFAASSPVFMLLAMVFAFVWVFQA